jgi:nitrite reductase/ring-hydroxylating ferredoxin subunit
MTDRRCVGSACSIAEGKACTVQAFGRTIAIFRAQGELYAIDDCCPHHGGPLGEGDLEGLKVACPLHGWTFELATGRMVGGAGSIRVPVYRLTVVGDEIFLDAPGSDGA